MSMDDTSLGLKCYARIESPTMIGQQVSPPNHVKVILPSYSTHYPDQALVLLGKAASIAICFTFVGLVRY
jgi:hypothetical protein